MSQDQVLSIFKQALWLVLELAGPMLLISIILGLVIAIIQAATQVHEQTLTFVPKLIAIGVILIVTAPWMMGVMEDFTKNLFDLMTTIV